jgi:transaldolase
MMNIIKINGYSIKIMGAAIRDIDYIINSLKLGIQAITLPQSAIEALLSDIPQTLDQEKAYNDFSNCIQQPQSDSLFKYIQY